MGAGPAGAGAPGLPLPPRRMEDPPETPDPPPPCGLAGPRGRRSALRGAWAWAWAWAGRRRRSRAPAGRRAPRGRRRAAAAAARRRHRWARARGLPGAGLGGLRLTPWSPAPGAGHAPPGRTPSRGGDPPAGEGSAASGCKGQTQAGAGPREAAERWLCGRAGPMSQLPGERRPRSHPRVPVSWGPGSGKRSLPGLHGPTGQSREPSGPTQTEGGHPSPCLTSPRVSTPTSWTSGLPGASSPLGLRGCPRAAASPGPAHPHGGANSSSLHPGASSKVQIPEPPPSDTQAGPSHYSAPRTPLLQKAAFTCGEAPPLARPCPPAKPRPPGALPL